MGETVERPFKIGNPPSRKRADRRFHDEVALQVLCRVFDDGADEGFQEWLVWYDPTSWLSAQRALGAFIHERLERKDGGFIRIHPEPRCETCGGPHGFMFNTDCPARWAHRFVRAPDPEKANG